MIGKAGARRRARLSCNGLGEMTKQLYAAASRSSRFEAGRRAGFEVDSKHDADLPRVGASVAKAARVKKARTAVEVSERIAALNQRAPATAPTPGFRFNPNEPLRVASRTDGSKTRK